MNPTPEDIDRSFRNSASEALTYVKLAALEFMAEHPDASLVDLARLLNRGATARGLTTLIYEEASEKGSTREVARELLFRTILRKFADGWQLDENVHPIVKLGGWSSAIAEFSPEFSNQAEAVLRELTIDNVPPNGWRPQSANDERLQRIFDKCWPTDHIEGQER